MTVSHFDFATKTGGDFWLVPLREHSYLVQSVDSLDGLARLLLDALVRSVLLERQALRLAVVGGSEVRARLERQRLVADFLQLAPEDQVLGLQETALGPQALDVLVQGPDELPVLLSGQSRRFEPRLDTRARRSLCLQFVLQLVNLKQTNRFAFTALARGICSACLLKNYHFFQCRNNPAIFCFIWSLNCPVTASNASEQFFPRWWCTRGSQSCYF